MLFARIGIFVDGFTLGSAVEVCSDDGLPNRVFESLTLLVDKSLMSPTSATFARVVG